MLSEFNQDGWTTLVKNSVDVKVSAKYAAEFSAGVSFEHSEETSEAQTYNKATNNQSS